MKVIVYVEGKGDRLCLETLLHPLLKAKEAAGVSIRFIEMQKGDRKTALLTTAPQKAAYAIRNDPQILVVILPDLYPRNKAFDHTTCDEMRAGVVRRFRQVIGLGHQDAARFEERFQVFCLIHDLEVLLLAAEEQLLTACGLETPSWTTPVEEQDQDNPPKRIVEKLIRGYQPAVDGPRILAGAHYPEIAARCPHGFGLFVAFLESI